MQGNTLIPSDAESDEEIADIIEKQFLPKTPSATSTSTDQGGSQGQRDTPIITRAASQKRPANYPIQEPPLTRRKGNPTRSHTEIIARFERGEEERREILANQELLKANQTQIVERLDRMIKMILDCQTRMSVAEARIQGMQETRRERATGPEPSTSHEQGTSTGVTPHVAVERSEGTAPSKGAGAFI